MRGSASALALGNAMVSSTEWRQGHKTGVLTQIKKALSQGSMVEIGIRGTRHCRERSDRVC